MPRYRCSGKVSADIDLGVFEAENEEEAQRMALKSEDAQIKLCYFCSLAIEYPEVVSVETYELGEGEE